MSRNTTLEGNISEDSDVLSSLISKWERTIAGGETGFVLAEERQVNLVIIVSIKRNH